MAYCSKTIFPNKEQYMEKHKIDMSTFINIYILYSTLSFNTIMRQVKTQEEDRKKELNEIILEQATQRAIEADDAP